MSETYITHKTISDYADNKINLRRDEVKEYRDQVNRLRDNLKVYIDDHPDYNLIKMIGSGSVPKGTALKTLNDMDVAIYIKKGDNTTSESEILLWLQERLQEAYKNKNISPEQITINHHCVTISFKGTGLDVDVSPVICDDTSTDYGYLIKKTTGERVITNIPLHLKFIRTRKDRQPHDYRQVIRLIKWWVRNLKKNNSDFRFKSFLTELLCAHLADNGLVMKDYIAAMEAFFVYIIKSQLKDRISFTDNYASNKLPVRSSSAMEIFDPVNPENNIVGSYTDAARIEIIEAAHDALDAINEAKFATTQERAVACWRRIFGPSFNI
jgi:tRNA nucleotidyltransferase (CCA-adding enzyme)